MHGTDNMPIPTHEKIVCSHKLPDVNPVGMLLYMMAPWGFSINTIHHMRRTSSFTAISLHHFVPLMNKISKRSLFAELGSWEVLLCWHLGCLFTSHSRPHSGCFWLSATIWNANRFLRVKLSSSSMLVLSAHRLISFKAFLRGCITFPWASVHLAAEKWLLIKRSIWFKLLKDWLLSHLCQIQLRVCQIL